MPTPGRGQFIRERFDALVESIWPAYGPDVRVSSTFHLFRKATRSSVTALGVPKVPWEMIAQTQPCMYLGAWSESAQRFAVNPPGEVQQTQIVVWTIYQEVHEGDDILLAADSRHYFVKQAQIEGGLRRLLCDASQSQLGGVVVAPMGFHSPLWFLGMGLTS